MKSPKTEADKLNNQILDEIREDVERNFGTFKEKFGLFDRIYYGMTCG